MIFAMTQPVGFESSGNSRGHSKSFSFSLPRRSSKSSPDTHKPKMSVSQVKLQLELSFQDMQSHEADHLRHRIRSAREVKDVWMLRSDVHQLISRQISQHVAAERINALLHCFEQWLPEKTLLRI